MQRWLTCALVLALALSGWLTTSRAAADDGPGRRWWSYVRYLASDRMEGRNTGSDGYRRAAEYVAAQFARAGLKPAGTNGYFQPIRFTSRRIIEHDSSLALVRKTAVQPLALGEDATLSMRIKPPARVEAPIVFVGYGLTVPELHYDDLIGLDLRGKVAFFLTGGPSSIPGPLRSHAQSAGERWAALKKAGAIGTISVANPRSMDVPWARATLARLQAAMSLADPALDDTAGQQMAVTLNPAHADKLLAGSGHAFAELLALADAGKRLPTFAIPASIRAYVRFESGPAESPNVAGILEGTDPALKQEFVVLSAHLDHVGVGEPIKKDRIYNGAMDNASGSATLLDIAATLHESNRRFRRSLLFLAVTGEEKGLLGSKYFAAHPTVPAGAIVADLNTDMFLPLFPLRILTVLGLDESDLGEVVRAVAAPLGIRVAADPQPERNLFIRSDQYSFIRRGIPSLALKVGFEPKSPEEAVQKKWLTERYHAPSDDLQQPVNLEAAAAFGRVLLALAEAVADRTERPHWYPRSFFRRFAS